MGSTNLASESANVVHFPHPTSVSAALKQSKEIMSYTLGVDLQF
jgi:hypothetical protein